MKTNNNGEKKMKLWTNDYECIMAETAEEVALTFEKICGDRYDEEMEWIEQSFPVRFFDEDKPDEPVMQFDSIDDLIDAGYKPGEICFCTD